MLVSVIVVAAILAGLLARRDESLRWRTLIWVSAVVGPGGMLFARYGAVSGLPWWIYYTVPMLLTLFLPYFVFQMKGREWLTYLLLALLSAPAIHIVFALTLGWREYMPFLPWP
jgi:hypothetical protein